MYITKNGTNDLVVLSDETYENLKKNLEKTEDERKEKKYCRQYKKETFKLSIRFKLFT